MRRALPDNLDPLVDTLSNVVGILVIVLALTQIELGGALERVLGLEAARLAEERTYVEEMPEMRAALEAHWAALAERGIPADAEAIAIADEVLEVVAEFTPRLPPDPAERAAKAEALARLRDDNADASRALEDRRAQVEAIRSVPPERVARLPNPHIERGRETWVLVRYGRVFPVDRKTLVEIGARALGRLLDDSFKGKRAVRADELESAALYLRKRSVGQNGFRWHLLTDEPARVELDWPGADRGIEPVSLDADRRWRRWLAGLQPGRDFVRFHVWTDSFEAYGAARQAIETAGIGASWVGHERDDEIELPISFGRPLPDVRELEVD